MKTKKLLSTCFFALYVSYFFGQSVGDYKSVATGNWNALATWNQCNVAGSWAACTVIPTAASGTITIQSPTIVTLTGSISNSASIIINSGGKLQTAIGVTLTNNAAGVITNNGTLVNSSTGATGTIINNGALNNNLTFTNNGVFTNNLTLNNATGATITHSGAAGITGFANAAGATINNIGTLGISAAKTLSNSGIIINSGTITTTGTLVFNNGSKYQHNFSSAAAAFGTIPNATWSAGSTCEILACGNTTLAGATSGLGQVFSDFIWNNSTQTVDINLNGRLNTVRNFTIQNTSASNLILKNTTTVIATTVVTGDLIIQNGSLILTNGDENFASSSEVMTVAGNYTQTGGSCTLTNSGGTIASGTSGNGTITVTGNLNLSAGTLNLCNSYAATTVQCNGVFNLTGNCAITGGTLNLSSSITTGGGGNGTLNVLGNFAHTAGTVSKTGINSGTINIDGTAAQTIESIGFTSGNTIGFNVTQTTATGTCSIVSAKSFVLNNGTTFTLNDNVSAAADFTINGTFETHTNTWVPAPTPIFTAAPLITVNGTFYNFDNGLINAKTDSTTLVFNAGSLYEHNANGGQVPTATWNSTSTVEVVNGFTTADSLGNGGQRFGNIWWNTTTQTNSAYFGKTISTRQFIVQSNFTVDNTGSGTLRFPDVDFSIGGNLSVNNASKLQVSFGPGLYTPAARNISISGDVSTTGTSLITTGPANTTVAGTGNKSRDYTFLMKKDYTYSSTTPIISFDQRTFGGTVNNESYHLIFNFCGGITQNYSSTTGAGNLTAGSLTNEFVSNNPYNITLTNNSTLMGLSDIKYKLLLVNTGSKLDMTSGIYNLIHYSALTTANATDAPTSTIAGTLDFGLGQLTDASGTGTFTINSGATLLTKHAQGITSTGSGLVGCIRVTGTRTYDPAANYTYNGTAAQVTGNGLPAALTAILTINNTTALLTGGVTLTQNTSTTGTLALTTGKLITAAANLITIASGGTVSPVGGSATSFVDGPIKKTLSTAFIFPTGNVDKWARIGISASIDPFTAQYFKANPQVAIGNTLAATINHVSYVEYWQMARNSGTAAVPTVTLYWENGTYSGIYSTNTIDLHVAEWYLSGTNKWNDQNVASITGTTAAGTITNSTANSFTAGTTYPFTFAAPNLINILPIELLSFTGLSVSAGNQLSWSTATETNNNYFDLERSADATEFSKIATVNGSGNSTNIKNYGNLDPSPFNGINYYRLKQVDFNGDFTYSNIIAIDRNAMSNPVVQIFPNPSNDVVHIIVPGNVSEITIYDMLGNIVYTASSDLNNTIEFKPLANGVYVVKSITADGKVTSSRFVKN